MKNFVIIGSGFSAINLAIQLAEKFKCSSFYKVYLVSEQNYLTYKPLLVRFSFEYKDPKKYKNLIALPILEIIKDKKIKFIHKNISRIDFSKKRIRFQDKSKIEYTKLIYALESEISISDTPGVKEYANFVHDLNDCVSTNQAFNKTIKANNSEYKVVVVGAGISGIESVNMAHTRLNSYFAQKDPSFHITLIEQFDILKDFSKKIAERIYNKLESKNIQIIQNKKIKRVYRHCVQYNDGKIQEYDLLIWAGGVQAHKIFKDSKFVKDQNNFLLTNDNFQMLKQTDVYAIGDSRSKDMPRTIAQNIHESNLLANNIYREVMHEKLDKLSDEKIVFTDLGSSVIAINNGQVYNSFRTFWAKNFQELIILNIFLPPLQAVSLWFQILKIYLNK
ncbi:MAG: FAD-dependent oxidoreductase [bacterium]